MIKLIPIVLLLSGTLLPMSQSSAEAPIHIKPVVKQVVVVAKKVELIKQSCDALLPEFSKYDWDVQMALKISSHESGCDPKNHNYDDVHKKKDGTILCLGSWNALSVGCGHYKKGEDINDFPLNVKKGYEIYKSSGGSFKQWSTCKDISGCK